MKTIHDQRDEIERQMNDAINNDEYAKAAQLRDRLQLLGFDWVSPQQLPRLSSRSAPPEIKGKRR